MNSYGDFAYVYDALIKKDMDYEKWTDYIENIFTRLNINPDTICDLACGTGNITSLLKKRGYDMTGIDASEDMLSVAAQKPENAGVRFIEGDLASLPPVHGFDAVTCMIDGVNYLISPKSVLGLFKRVKNTVLNQGGVFIFDISSQYKLESIIGNNTFIHGDYDIYYSWQNSYNEKKRIADMFLTFFVRDGAKYRRFEERQLQRAYSEDEIRRLLKRAGFETVNVYDELSFEPPKADSQRIVFVCR